MKKSKLKSKKRGFSKKWREKIEKSGKLFEHKIATMIQNEGFGWTIPNYVFTDPEEGKSRELDVFVISAKRLGRGRKWNFLFPILLIAIKSIPLVCFARKEIMSRYTLGDIHFSGMPKNIYSRGEEFDLTEYLKLEKFHHFYKYREISSQFWVPPLKNKSGIKEDYIYRGMIFPLIKAVEAEKKDHEDSWYFDPEGEQINLQFYYPIIVVRELWKCSLTKDTPRYSKISRIGFLARYSSMKVSGEYLIDICDEAGLRDVLQLIDHETDRISKFIRRKIKIFENSAFEDAKKRIDKK